MPEPTGRSENELADFILRWYLVPSLHKEGTNSFLTGGFEGISLFKKVF